MLWGYVSVVCSIDLSEGIEMPPDLNIQPMLPEYVSHATRVCTSLPTRVVRRRQTKMNIHANALVFERHNLF